MTAALQNTIRPTFGPGTQTLHCHAFIDIDARHFQFVHVSTFIIFSIGNRRIENLLHDLRCFLVAEFQQIQRFFNLHAAHLVCYQAGFLGRNSGAFQSCCNFHFLNLASPALSA
jgi:hypothetical protein